MTWMADDWRRLERMRATFLALGESGGSGITESYWRSQRDLEVYDAFFAARIRWKWEAALGELETRGWNPPRGRVLDFGCGTGAASRAWLSAFPDAASEVALWDASAAAREFAAEQLSGAGVEVNVLKAEPVAGEDFDVLLVSHVQNELNQLDRERLLALAGSTRCVVWVEPGDRPSARVLAEARDALTEQGRIVAPCTHQQACGTLTPGNEHEWCHQFARPPREIFQSADWARFAERLGVDLRSLPFAFFAWERGPGSGPSGITETQELTRVLGRPRVEKGRAFVHTCDASGVRTQVLMQRLDKQLFKALRDCAGQSFLLELQSRDGRVTAARRVLREPSPE